MAVLTIVVVRKRERENKMHRRLLFFFLFEINMEKVIIDKHYIYITVKSYKGLRYIMCKDNTVLLLTTDVINANF